MYLTGAALAVLLFGYDIYSKFIQDKFFPKSIDLYDGNINYFSLLSKLDKKRWLAEEVYMHKEFGFQLTSDYTF